MSNKKSIHTFPPWAIGKGGDLVSSIGKNGLRAILVEASWKLITKDGAMRDKYEWIKARSGGKRAIVAITRTLLLRLRRMLLDGCPYGLGVVG